MSKLWIRIFDGLARRNMLNWIPDNIFLKISYRGYIGEKLRLDMPKNFNEKLQWLKLKDRKDIYTQMVDKYEAKFYVSNLIGDEYIIPTLGVWDSFDEIDFDKLPQQFVIKCTHDSGGLYICRDKSKMDKISIKHKIEKSLKKNYYWSSREWPYKNVIPRIIVEKYMENDGIKGLRDYKFYCFGGKVHYLYVSEGLEDHSTAKISFATPDWKIAPFGRLDYAPYKELPPKPKNLTKMIELAEKLSKGIPFLRVDLYEINEKVYFSELTFSPCAGWMPFSDEKWNDRLGDLIVLPSDECTGI